MDYEIEEIEFAKKPILVFKKDGRIYLSFGLAKAKIIVDNIETIKRFLRITEK